MSASPKRLRTNIQALDSHLSGGVPPGAIVTLTSDPRTQSEMFIHKIASGTDTFYISTVANENAVKAEFKKSQLADDVPSVVYVKPDSPLQQIRKHIEKRGEVGLIIINFVNVIEDSATVSRGSYQEFLNWVQNMNRHTGNVVLFHRYRSASENSHSALTDSVSDIIFEIEEVVTGEKVDNYLHMPKCRGGVALDERLKLEISQDIAVDTSRDIA